MMRRSRLATLLTLAGAIAALAPVVARGNHCETALQIVSEFSGGAQVDSSATPEYCLATGRGQPGYELQESVDARIIYPGAAHVVVILYPDKVTHSSTQASLNGTLDGLGFTGEKITLTPRTDSGGTLWESPPVEVDSSTPGCLTAAVDSDGDGATDVSARARTIGGDCPLP